VVLADLDLATRRRLASLEPWRGQALAEQRGASIRLEWEAAPGSQRLGYSVTAGGRAERSAPTLVARSAGAPLWVARPETDEFAPP
jgi:hypothetical protein